MDRILLPCDPQLTMWNQTSDAYSWSQSASMDPFLFYTHYMHNELSILICIIGIVGNVLLFGVLIRPSMLVHGGHGSVHVILAAIAVADLLTNVTNYIYVLGRWVAHHNQSTCSQWSLFIHGYAWNVFVLIHADSSVFLHACSL